MNDRPTFSITRRDPELTVIVFAGDPVDAEVREALVDQRPGSLGGVEDRHAADLGRLRVGCASDPRKASVSLPQGHRYGLCPF
jgi:hypothetical protein